MDDLEEPFRAADVVISDDDDSGVLESWDHIDTEGRDHSDALPHELAEDVSFEMREE